MDSLKKAPYFLPEAKLNFVWSQLSFRLSFLNEQQMQSCILEALSQDQRYYEFCHSQTLGSETCLLTSHTSVLLTRSHSAGMRMTILCAGGAFHFPDCTHLWSLNQIPRQFKNSTGLCSQVSSLFCYEKRLEFSYQYIRLACKTFFNSINNLHSFNECPIFWAGIMWQTLVPLLEIQRSPRVVQFWKTYWAHTMPDVGEV